MTKQKVRNHSTMVSMISAVSTPKPFQYISFEIKGVSFTLSCYFLQYTELPVVKRGFNQEKEEQLNAGSIFNSYSVQHDS